MIYAVQKTPLKVIKKIADKKKNTVKFWQSFTVKETCSIIFSKIFKPFRQCYNKNIQYAATLPNQQQSVQLVKPCIGDITRVCHRQGDSWITHRGKSWLRIICVLKMVGGSKQKSERS